MLFTVPDGWVFFFDLFSYSGLRAFFTSDLWIVLQIVLQITPTIRCCSQHLMVGFFFFLTSSPILDLEHFSQVILWIVLQIMPPPKLTQPSGAVQSIWWLGFFFLPLLLFWTKSIFHKLFYELYYRLCPSKLTQPSGAVHSIWWLGFFLTSSPILDLEHFSQVVLWIVLQIMSPPQINPTIRCCSQHLMVGFFFFWSLLLFWT